ncbi:MAG: hypothetical protein GX781_06500 [Clostridiales bacterium]|nr:hypothetical protein [Clostridiales bacterium]
MKKYKLLAILLMIIGLSTAVAHGAVRASEIIYASTAALGASKTATFMVKTKVSCNQLGTTKYTLYKKGGTKVAAGILNDYGSGSLHASSVNLSPFIQSGNSYYVAAYFYADGETSSATSGTISY